MNRPARAALSPVLLLGLLILMGAYFRLRGLDWGLYGAAVTRRPHPDEWVVYWMFHWFDLYHRLNPCPQSATKCFFDWGAVFPTLAYVTRDITSPLHTWMTSSYGSTASRPFVLAVLSGRITSALLSIAVIPTAWLWARVVSGPGAASLAAAVVALAALPIQLAHFATPDSTTLLLSTCALLACSLSLALGAPGGVVGAAALAGLATGSEYHMILLAAPVLLTWWLVSRKLSILAAAAGTAALCFVLTNPFVVVQWPDFVNAALHTLRIRTVESGIQYQGRFDRYGPDWLYVIRFPLGYGLGAPATVLVLAGSFLALRTPTRQVALLLSWIVPYWLLISLSSAKFLRYGSPLIPALAVLAALGLVSLRSRGFSRLLLFAAGTLAAIWTIAYLTAYTSLFTPVSSRFAAARWISAHIPRSQTLTYEQKPDGLMDMPYFTAPRGYRSCYVNFSLRHACAPGGVVVTDAYDIEDHPDASTQAVMHFTAALSCRSLFTRLYQASPQPSAFGLTFSLTGSPHDWRYPAHVIAVYRPVSPPVQATACSPS